MRDDQLLGGRRAGGRQRLVELRQAEGGQDGGDVGVVREVEEELLRRGRREGRVRAVQRRVQLRRAVAEREGLRQPRVQLFHPPDAYGAPCRRAEHVVAVEVDVDRVLVALPFGQCEEVAEVGEAKGYGFVGAELLHAVDLGGGPVEGPRGHGAESLRGVGEVGVAPGGGQVAAIGGEVGVGVVAVVIAGEGVVDDVGGGFREEFQRGVARPVEPEEAGEEVLARFEHPVLRCGSGNDLGAVRVVQLSVLVVVEDSGVEEFLTASGHHDLVAELVLVLVHEGQGAAEFDSAVGGDILDQLPDGLDGGSGGWVT